MDTWACPCPPWCVLTCISVREHLAFGRSAKVKALDWSLRTQSCTTLAPHREIGEQVGPQRFAALQGCLCNARVIRRRAAATGGGVLASHRSSSWSRRGRQHLRGGHRLHHPSPGVSGPGSCQHSHSSSSLGVQLPASQTVSAVFRPAAQQQLDGRRSDAIQHRRGWKAAASTHRRVSCLLRR